MTRIQRLAGQLKFGELDDVSVSYDDTTGELVVEHATGVMIIAVGTPGPGDVTVDLKSKGFKQTYTVRLQNTDGDPRTLDTLVEASAGVDDGFTIGGVNSTAIIGAVKDASIAAAAEGQIAIIGVADVVVTAATNRGDYLATGAVAGEATPQAGLPAAGRTVGIALTATGGAGMVRAMLVR